jgi:hypothetical protein
MINAYLKIRTPPALLFVLTFVHTCRLSPFSNSPPASPFEAPSTSELEQDPGHFPSLADAADMGLLPCESLESLDPRQLLGVCRGCERCKTVNLILATKETEDRRGVTH